VPARLIEEAATHYGRQHRPSLRHASSGDREHRQAWSGHPYLNRDLNLPERYLDDAYLTAAHLAANANPRISHMELASYLEDAARTQALVC
jgi:hypothetical protein